MVVSRFDADSPGDKSGNSWCSSMAIAAARRDLYDCGVNILALVLDFGVLCLSTGATGDLNTGEAWKTARHWRF